MNFREWLKEGHDEWGQVLATKVQEFASIYGIRLGSSHRTEPGWYFEYPLDGPHKNVTERWFANHGYRAHIANMGKGFLEVTIVKENNDQKL